MLALTWRCDGSEGIKWYLRGIRADGSFYGEIRFQSSQKSLRRATSVTGQLFPHDCKRMAELAAVISQHPAPAKPGPHFAALFERLSTTDAGDVKRLFEYHQGDESRSEHARAFIELANILERHLSPFYVKIT